VHFLLPLIGVFLFYGSVVMLRGSSQELVGALIIYFLLMTKIFILHITLI